MCSDDAECIKNLNRVKKIGLLRHRPKPPNDKDWVAFRVSQAWTELGISLHSLLPRAMKRVVAHDCPQAGASDNVPAHNVEANPDGWNRVQGARIRDTASHFADAQMHITNRLVFIASKSPHEFLYELMSEGLDIHSMMDPNDSKLAKCLNDLSTLFDTWGQPASEWKLLSDLMPNYQDDTDCIHLGRRYCASMMATLIKTLHDESYGLDVFLMYPLRSDKFSHQYQLDRARWLIRRKMLSSTTWWTKRRRAGAGRTSTAHVRFFSLCYRGVPRYC